MLLVINLIQAWSRRSAMAEPDILAYDGRAATTSAVRAATTETPLAQAAC